MVKWYVTSDLVNGNLHISSIISLSPYCLLLLVFNCQFGIVDDIFTTIDDVLKRSSSCFFVLALKDTMIKTQMSTVSKNIFVPSSASFEITSINYVEVNIQFWMKENG